MICKYLLRKIKKQVSKNINVLQDYPAIELAFYEVMKTVPPSYKCKEFKKLQELKEKGVINAIFYHSDFYGVSIKGINNKKTVMNFIDNLNKKGFLTCGNVKYKFNKKISPYYYEKEVSNKHTSIKKKIN
jgi:hypothetical protein